jgi:hypothetical protein
MPVQVCATYFSNAGDQTIHVETTGVNIYVDPDSIGRADLNIGETYLIKLMKGRQVKRFS